MLRLLSVLALFALTATAYPYDVTRTGGTVYVCVDSAGEIAPANHNEWQTLDECGDKADQYGREFRAMPGAEYVFTPDVIADPPIEPEPPEEPSDPGLPLMPGVVLLDDGNVRVTWIPPTEYTDGTQIGDGELTSHSVYSGDMSWNVPMPATELVAPLTDSGCYFATATAGGLESSPSATVCAEDPAQPPPVLTSIPEIPFDYLATPGLPTETGPLPNTLAAGTVYQFTDRDAAGDYNLACNGTEAQPVFILGGLFKGDNGVLQISGSWCYFVDTRFDNMQVRTSGDHLIFRNIEVANVAGKNGVNLGGSDIVLVDSEVHHNQGNDRHGIHVSGGSDRVWILRNDVHHNGGDGFQACHGCSANPPRNVYIGGNMFHSDRENAIDFKYITNVIVEGNTIHSLVSAPADQEWCFDDGSGCGVFSSGSDGSGIVVGSDGAPTGVVITGNEIYGTVNAVRIEEGDGVRIEGNNFHDIRARCLQLDKQGMFTIYSGNTCTNAEHGINQNWREGFSLVVDGNTFENVAHPIVYESGSVGDASTLTGNIFRGSGPVVYNNVTAADELAINALPGAAGNTVE